MSNLNVNAINGVDVQNIAKQTARAWVNFNGTGVVAIRKAYNVASITDNGSGDYTVNFATPMPDANFAAAFSHNNANLTGVLTTAVTTLSHRGVCYGLNSGGTPGPLDPSIVNAIFFD